MNGTRESAVRLVGEMARAFETRAFEKSALKNNSVAAEVVLCPSTIHLPLAAEVLAGTNSCVQLGAQNCSEYQSGAYTGEISAIMIAEFACQYVIIGHSERRQLFAESSAQIAAKFQQIQAQGMTPILCIGEQQEHRKAGQTFDIIHSQLLEVIDIVGIDAFENAVLAYEPVWAIGTGLTATPEQAEEVHAYIRGTVSQIDAVTADKLRIIYGGSVKPENASELFLMPNIDGGLIGGASLNTEDFMAICRAIG